MNPTKKLYRSNTNKIIAGVLGGLGEYMNVDPTVLRLLAIFVTLITGIVPGIVVYVLAFLIVPEKPGSASTDIPVQDKPII